MQKKISQKKMELKHEGAYYSVSPWALCWDDEKYYLIGYDNRERKIKHFRVDKMMDVSVVYEERKGEEEFSKMQVSEYTNRPSAQALGLMMPVSERVGRPVLLARTACIPSVRQREASGYATEEKITSPENTSTSTPPLCL